MLGFLRFRRSRERSREEELDKMRRELVQVSAIRIREVSRHFGDPRTLLEFVLLLAQTPGYPVELPLYMYHFLQKRDQQKESPYVAINRVLLPIGIEIRCLGSSWWFPPVQLDHEESRYDLPQYVLYGPSDTITLLIHAIHDQLRALRARARAHDAYCAARLEMQKALEADGELRLGENVVYGELFIDLAITDRETLESAWRRALAMGLRGARIVAQRLGERIWAAIDVVYDPTPTEIYWIARKASILSAGLARKYIVVVSGRERTRRKLEAAINVLREAGKIYIPVAVVPSDPDEIIKALKQPLIPIK
ncbi:MAG: hypothetical protein GXO32_05000 [Crenarchaeota archaeon]|nr:hypothetical protein [Thermoproteota archaeon]